MGGDDARWTSAVYELAQMPEVAKRLVEDHGPDEGGRCRACTYPGGGTAHIRWPCSLYRLATQAVEQPPRQ